MKATHLLCASFVLALGLTQTSAEITVTVDVTKERRTISPFIYGINYGGHYYELNQPDHASGAVIADLNAAFVRDGGNLLSRYNWQINCANHAFDYFYESIAEDGQPENDKRHCDIFIRRTANAGAIPSVTVPMIPYLSKLAAGRGILPSYSIEKYGAQDASDPFFPDAGNGSKNGVPIITNTKTDASSQNSTTFAASFIDYLKLHPSGVTPVRYFTMDNEPDLWSSTHADVVRPHRGFSNGQYDPRNEGDKSEAFVTRYINYASKVKSRNSKAILLGPETSGYFGYLVSPFDRQYANNLAANGDPNAYFSYPLDGDLAGGYRTHTSSNPNGEYMPWLLGELHAAEAEHGRLLDYFTLHYYADTVALNLDVSPAMQTLRSRSTRSLWDPNFTANVDGTTANLKLIRQMRAWVSSNYPGTKIGITEYNWGADNHINGATALADVLGIFGREKLHLATAYPYPPPPGNDLTTSGFTYSAFKMYRNYDGKKSTFGNVHVRLAPMPDPNSFGFFAAERTSDRKLTIMLVNKGPSAENVTVNLAGFTATGSADLWRLGVATSAIKHLAGSAATLSSSRLQLSLPAQSITLAVLTRE